MRELLNRVTILGRYLLSILSLLAVVGWLLLSYLPKTTLSLPVLALPLGWSASLQATVVIGLLLFVFIQLLVLASTLNLRNRDLHQVANQVANSVTSPLTQEESLPLNMAAELFWTVLPLIMTLGLALVSYQSWAHL